MVNLDATVYSSEPFNPLDYVEEFVPRFEEADQAVAFIDISDVVWKMDNWQQKMPRIKPHYAVKSNCDETMIKVLAKMGAGFDCASRNEIALAVKCGANADDIVYANPVKSLSYLKFARKMGVDLMTFDRISELEKVKDVFPNAQLLVRIRFSSKDCVWSFERFGCDPNSEARELIKAAKDLDLNIAGVSFHVGCATKDPIIFRYAMEAAHNLFEYGKSLGFQMNVLNLGGGFPPNRGPYLDKFAKVINQALEDLFSDSTIRIIAEPGQYFSASAGTIFTTVIGIRMKNKGSEIERQYSINDSIFNSLTSYPTLLYASDLHGIRRSQTKAIEADKKKYSTIIYGQTCDGDDLVVKDIKMKALEMGDLIYFTNSGAYTFCNNTSFNGFVGPTFRYFIHARDSHLLRN